MATELTPLGIFGKWIVIPAALASVGYYVVGPRIQPMSPAGNKASHQQTDKHETSKDQSPESSSNSSSGSNLDSTPTQDSHVSGSVPSSGAVPSSPAKSSLAPEAASNSSSGPEVEITEKSSAGGQSHVVYSSSNHRTCRDSNRSVRKSTKKKPVHVKTEVKVESTDTGSVGGLDGSPQRSSGSDPGN